MAQLVADLVIMNGKVITVDKHFSITQAVAVKDGRIIAVGKNEEVKDFINRGTKVLDIQGKVMLPGINDSHTHTALYAGTKPPLAVDVGYPAVKSIMDIQKAVAEKAKTVKPDEWIRGVGWDEGFLEECLKDTSRHPTRWDLDAVSPSNPVCLGDFSVHSLWLNSKALECAGITNETHVPTGGEIVKDPSTGEITGIIRELAAQGLVMRVIPPWTKAQKKEAILAAIKELNSLGVTSLTEAALGPGGIGYQGGLLDAECISIYNDLLNENKLSARVNILYLFGEYGACSYKDLQQIVPNIGIHSGFGNEWLKIGGIKVFADGTPPNKTSWMSEEYIGGGTGGLVIPGATDQERSDELRKMIRFAHQHGFQVGAHAVGDRAIEACIDSFIKAEHEEPKGLRHYVIHGDFIMDKDIRRAARYNIGICAQPAIKWTISDYMENLVGEERSARQWPLRTLIDAGAHVSGSSDAPVTYPNWKQGIQSAVLRESKASGKVSGPEQRITREEAIRMYTIESAWQDHMDNLKGSIEVGKLADLCILDKDIMSVEPHSIKDIWTLTTIVGGKIVHDTRLL